MSLSPGARLGSYEVTARIGQGGMGEVYQARDTKLDRDVALKVLPDAFTSDPDRLARFEREAKVLASLNHPNIGHIYGLEEAEGTKALVLELVEGPTLADRIAEGPIPIDDALPIAKQIAEALEAAHEQGIIHRDLKPANVKVKADGTVKVLDFGLAKAFQADVGSDPSQSPTVTAATQEGVILGTAAYMSPEAASGKGADKRSDIWSFGVVLFEMLAGRRLFTGETVPHVLASVLKTDPDWARLPADTPEAIRRLLRRCLAKERKRRLSGVSDALLEIEESQTASVHAITSPQHSDASTRRRALPWAAAILFAVVTGLVVWNVTRPDPPRVVRFPLGVPVSLRAASGVPSVVVSPDGGRVVTVAAGGQFYVRQIDQLEAIPLRGAVGINPFFSPDGRSVGFRGAGFTDDNLHRVSIDGGVPVTLTEGIGGIFGASWGPDGIIVLAPTLPGPLFRLAATGGERQPLTALVDGEHAHRWPEFLPGGEALLFTVVNDEGRSDPERFEIWVLDLTSDERKFLVAGGGNPHYAPTGHVVYGVNGTLRAVPFDLGRLAVTGGPIPVLEDVVTSDSGSAHFSLSQDGSLVYATGGIDRLSRSLVWVDRDGSEEPISAMPRPYHFGRLSPDGQEVVLSVDSPTGSDVWILDVRTGGSTQLTFDPVRNRFPLFTSDGGRVVYSSDFREDAGGLFWKAADGTGPVDRLTTSGSGFQAGFSWSDGKLVMAELRAPTYSDIGIVSVDGDPTIEWLLEREGNQTTPVVSPDGRWIAYATDESGQYEVFVRPFPSLSGDGWKISEAGGFSPLWGPDGRELFFRNRDGAMMAAAYVTEPTFSHESPVQLFPGPYVIEGNAELPSFDVAPDGRFLMLKDTVPDARSDPQQIILVQNWHEELKRLVPVD